MTSLSPSSCVVLSSRLFLFLVLSVAASAAAELPAFPGADGAGRFTSGGRGEWRIARTGGTSAALTVRYTVGGDARPGHDYAALSGAIAIPAGADSVTLPLSPLPGADDNRTVVVTLLAGAPAHFNGCPAQSLVVIRHQ